jgi:hypothetical protein
VKIAVALVAGPLLAVTAAVPALAAAPERVGWWYGSSLASGALPPPPDVPPDGLLIQGGPAGPTAFGAVVFQVEGAAHVDGLLRLAFAEGGNHGPVRDVQACPLSSGDFLPAAGGPMSSAPAYDCADGVAATVGETGLTFNVSSLLVGGSLAVALIPAQATRVVLAVPGEDTLPVTGEDANVGTGAGAEEPSTQPSPRVAPAPADSLAFPPALDLGNLVDAARPPDADPPGAPILAEPATELPLATTVPEQPVGLAAVTRARLMLPAANGAFGRQPPPDTLRQCPAPSSVRSEACSARKAELAGRSVGRCPPK